MRLSSGPRVPCGSRQPSPVLHDPSRSCTEYHNPLRVQPSSGHALWAGVCSLEEPLAHIQYMPMPFDPVLSRKTLLKQREVVGGVLTQVVNVSH
jgi:hypothetical protein